VATNPVISVFPLPWEIPAAAGHPVRFVRLNHCDFDGLPALPAARGLDPRAALLSAAVRAVGVLPAWSGGASDLKEIHGALLAALGPGQVRTFPWPLAPDADALTDELQDLARLFGLVDLRAAEEVHARDEAWRAPLRAWEREQGEAPVAPCPSRLYRDTLAAATSTGLLTGPPALPCPPPLAPADATRLRLGLAGGVELLTDLPEHLERAGARVVIDEWIHACAFVAPSAGLVDRYLGLGLPYGLEARACRLRAFEEPRRVDAWVLVTSPFGASNLERLGFPCWLERPVLALEADARRPLAAADVLRLEAFLRTLREARR